MKLDRINMEELDKKVVSFRREFHKYAESAWTEYRTTVRIIQELRKAGIPYLYGKAIHTDGKRVSLREPELDRECMERAIAETGETDLIHEMAGGYTGAVAVIDGALSGPTIAIRCDIDSNDLQEDIESEDRIPVREGFASVHPNMMHGCGHDSHAAIGLGTALILNTYRDQLKGRVMIVFQPAEEGGRGALSLVQSGLFDNVDYFFAGHYTTKGPDEGKVGEIYASAVNLSVSYKIDLFFKGKAAHAGAAPELGHNALAAACNATLNMLAIARHSGGRTRVNVGMLNAGTGRNVVPESATMIAEVRAMTDDVREYLLERVLEIGQGAAMMHGCEFSYEIKVKTANATGDPELVDLIEETAAKAEGIRKVFREYDALGGGDDACHIMRRVQQHGGKAAYMFIGASTVAPNHSSCYDLDESYMPIAVRLYVDVINAIGDKANKKS